GTAKKGARAVPRPNKRPARDRHRLEWKRGMTEASTPAGATETPEISVVVPVRNEADNVASLTAEIAAALTGRWRFELVYVNDGSGDATETGLSRLARRPPGLGPGQTRR